MNPDLARAHIVAQERLRALAARGVSAIWRELPGYDETDVEPFLRRAVPFVLAAQRQSVSLTDGFLARATGRRPLGVDPGDIAGAPARNGTPPDQVYRRPFVTVWTALQAGKQWEDAIAAGLARAASTAEMDIQLASRGTFAAVQRADPAIRGFQRVADGGACAFCLMIDGAFVKSADAMPLHNRCGCTLDPVVDGTVVQAPLPDGVAVHEHGELGPVLTDPTHHFTPEGAL